MRKKIVLMLAAAASLTLIPAPSHASTCAVADPMVDEIVCGVVYSTVFGNACEKPVNKVCENLN